MKKITLTMVLMSVLSSSYAFENEQLNVLYKKLQKRTDVLKQPLPQKLATLVYMVGDDIACQFGLIKEAIDAANLLTNANTYEIRVANNKTYVENLTINRANLSIKGGYANCSDANGDIVSGTNTQLDASGAALPAITFRNFTATKHFNKISNFDISGGTNVGSNLSGGVNVRDNNIEVNIESSVIFNNVGTKGGGLFAEGSLNKVYIKDTLMLLNEASDGGGLYCDAADVFIYGDSGISINNAVEAGNSGNGGGVYLTNGCGFNLFSGTSGGILDFRGISGNTADRNGGGIYADTGAQVLLMGYLFIGNFGNNDQPVNITGNKANKSGFARVGGGIYAKDSTTNINAYAAIINNNETLPGNSSSAGAVYLLEANFSISQINSTCWNQQKCNQISGNKSVLSNAGIMALTGSNVVIKNTWISGHSSETNVFFFGEAINAVIEGNVFTGNGGASIDGNNSLLFFNGDAGNLSVAYNTFVNNQINSSIFRLFNTPTLIVHGNIIKESNNVDILQVASGTALNAQFDCLVVHEDQSFSGSTIFIRDPDFVDEANEDFHLNSTSPAIDLCGNSLYSATTNDTDREERARDNVLTNNVDGVYDAGMDEYYPNTVTSHEIFADSFEG